MYYPKQIIYPINYFNYLKSFFFKKKNYEKDLVRKLQKLFSINKKIKLLGRARSGIYLAVKLLLKNSKNRIVLLSPFTIPEVIELVICAGGKPLFLEHEEGSTNISIKDLKKKIKLRPNSLILTHYNVNQKNYKDISSICRQNKVFLIEDCAISIKGSSQNTFIGSLSEFSIYSFSSFKFINYFLGGCISYKKKYEKTINKETQDWKQLKAKDYFSKFVQTFKFSILTNKYFFNFFTFHLLKYLSNNKKNFLDKKSYLKENFVLDKSYFSLPSNSAIYEIFQKTQQYKLNKAHRQKIVKVYFKYLHSITIPKNNDKKNFFKNNDFIHYLVSCKNKNHKYFIKKKLLNLGFDVGGFFYPNCSQFKKFSRYGKIKSVDTLINNLITLPTHPGINEKYAKKLSKKILEIY